MIRVCCFAVVACLMPVLVGSHATGQSPKAVDATYEENTWSLAGQMWDFSQLSTTYLPNKGRYDPETRQTTWTFELARELLPGEAVAHNGTMETPFKPVFLDDDRIVLLDDGPVKITPVSGVQGDRVRVTLLMPNEEVLSQVKLIRLERRTNIGF